MSARSQLSNKAMSLSVGFGVGGFAPHKAVTAHLLKGPSYKMEATVIYRTQGDRSFQRHYKFPFFGLTYGYNQSGSPILLGDMHSLNIFGALPLYEANYPIRFRAGFGVGYATQKFDKYSNHKNSAIGSNFNANIQLRLEKDISIAKKGLINVGLGLSHFSNASVQKPNLGLNFFHLYLNTGLQLRKYTYPGPDTLAVISILPYSLWETSVTCGAGLRENSTPLGSKFFVGVMTFTQTRRVSEFSSWSLALDNYVNMALYDEYSKWLQMGVSAAYLKHFNKIRVGLALGTYLLNKPAPEAIIYNKVIVEYHFNRFLFAQLLLKSHWAAADFFNLTIGYRIR